MDNLSTADLSVAAVAFTKAVKWGDSGPFLVPHPQYRAIIGFAHDRQIGAACRSLASKGAALYAKANIGRYARLSFHVDPDFWDRVPPDSGPWTPMEMVGLAYEQSLTSLFRLPHQGRKAALVLFCRLLAEGATWARLGVSLSDADAGLSAAQGVAARRILRGCGWHIEPGSGRSPTRYALSCAAWDDSIPQCAAVDDPQPPSERCPVIDLHTNSEITHETPLAGFETTTDVVPPDTEQTLEFICAFYKCKPTKPILNAARSLSRLDVNLEDLEHYLSCERLPGDKALGFGFIHFQLQAAVDYFKSACSQPSSLRARAEQAFFMELRAVIQHLDEDELDKLRVKAVLRGFPHGIIMYRGLSDELWVAYMSEVWALENNISFSAWVSSRIELVQTFELGIATSAANVSGITNPKITVSPDGHNCSLPGEPESNMS